MNLLQRLTQSLLERSPKEDAPDLAAKQSSETETPNGFSMRH
jgi:hypothetical protein